MAEIVMPVVMSLVVATVTHLVPHVGIVKDHRISTGLHGVMSHHVLRAVQDIVEQYIEEHQIKIKKIVISSFFVIKKIILHIL